SEDSFKIHMGIFLVSATVEASRVIRLKSLIGFVISIVLYFIFGFLNNFGYSQNLFITVFTFLRGLSLSVYLFSSDSLIITNDIYKYLLFVGYVVFPFIIITKIPLLNGSYQPSTIISIFLMIWVNDTFAYLVGKSFGIHKLLERISPKKTIEGFLGGAAFTVAVSLLIGNYFVEF